MRHLASFGHRRIGFLGDDPSISTATERLAGYRDALDAGGLTLDDALVRTGVRTEDDARAAVTQMLSLDEPPTALFTARNVLTVGAVRALRYLDLRDRVGLVGFDDFPTADLLEPGVTCVKQAVVTEGELAIDMLLSRLDGDEGPARVEVVPTTIVARGSGEISPAR